MKRIINYFRNLREQWKLSDAISRMYYSLPGSSVYDCVLIDCLNEMVMRSNPKLEDDLKMGIWVRASGCSDMLTVEHSRLNCRVVIL